MFNNSNNKMNNIKSMNKFYNIIMSDEYVQKEKGMRKQLHPEIIKGWWSQ